MARVFDSGWSEEAVLSDGRRVELRTLRPADALLLAKVFEKLSFESRYRRFHCARGELTAAELKYLTEVNGENHFALGALDAKNGEGLGVARFIRLPREPHIAEPAITVIDSVQGNGLGRLLLVRLAAAAQERGIESFRCLVLAGNEPVRGLLKRLALPAQPKYDGHVLQFDVPLAQMDIAAPALTRGHPFHDLVVAAAKGALLVADAVEHVRHWIAHHGDTLRDERSDSRSDPQGSSKRASRSH